MLELLLRGRIWIKLKARRFRHSFRDRLRAVECPSDVSDALGGWSAKGIGQRYGEGYKLNIMHQWISKIEMLRSLD